MRRVWVVCAAAVIGCSDGWLGDSDPGKADIAGGIVINLSGRPLKLADLNDPIAKLIQANGADSPTTFPDIVAAFEEIDGDCGGDLRNSPGVALVSETSQLLGRPDRFRAVVAKFSPCRDRPAEGLFLSPQGTFRIGGGLPSDVEVMALDPASGAYDFWAAEDGKWRFFGSSIDMLDGPGEPSNGTQERRCANCHTGGGPIMKELNLPWANWDGPTRFDVMAGETSPGSPQITTELNDLLGLPEGTLFQFTGDMLEKLIEHGNATWNKKRLAVLRERAPADLLEPLFCTVEINLGTSGGYREPATMIDRDFLIDQALKEFAPFPEIPGQAYISAITAAHQTMRDHGDNQLKDENGKLLIDTAFAFTHPARSFADQNYVTQLQAAKLVDASFIRAVLGVDFTTPVFSESRCELRKFAPAAGVDIKAGFIANLKAASPATGTPAQQLLAGLEGSATDLTNRVEAYLNACTSRAQTDPAGLASDAIAILSRRRNSVRGLKIFENRELLPEDTLNTPASAHLDPKTCKLVTGN